MAEKLAARAEQKALAQLANRSKKAIGEMFVNLSIKVARMGYPTFAKVLQGCLGAILNGLLSVFKTSIGQIVANIFDRLDGKRDGYIFA